MPRISPRNISLSVLVIGDAQANTRGLIKKFVNADSAKELPLVATRRIPFDINNVDMCFTSLDTDVNHEFVANSDVILFCYNPNEKTSYDAILNCFRRIHKGYQGMTALVGCVNEAVQPDPSIARLSGDLNQILRSVYPTMYLDNYVSHNDDASCGVSQLILNFIADKALKLNPAEPVVKPALRRAPIMNKPNIAMNALVLGQEGVGKHCVLHQMLGSDEGYVDQLGHFHKFLEFPEQSVHVELTPAVDVDEADAQNYHIALLCFDLTNTTSIEVLLDKIKSLMEFNPDITFAMLGNKRDLLSKEKNNNTKDIQNTMEVFIQCLSELYPYAFMGIYLNSTQDSRYNQATNLVKILSEKYLDKKENERALAELFMNAHKELLSKATLFSRTSILPRDENNFQGIVRKGSRPNKRSSLLFQSLGWFDEDAKPCETTPLPIQQIRKTMDMAGVNYRKKPMP